MDYSDIQQRSIISIRKRMIDGEIDAAVAELQLLIETLKNNDDIIETIQLLGYFLIILNIAEDKIGKLFKSSSEIIIRQKGAETLFRYWKSFYEQDPELYSYTTDISEKLLSQYSEKIEIPTMFDANVAWFTKYNKKFLKDLFEDSDYRLETLFKRVESAYATKNLLCYNIDQKWHVIHKNDKGQPASDEDCVIPLIYYINDQSHMITILNQHNTRNMINDTIKFDRYIIANSNTISVLMQILPFSQIDNGNYRFHFLLDTKWKSRLRAFVKMGYRVPEKGIAFENKLQKMLLFVKELHFYYQGLLQETGAELKKIYTLHYLKQLRERQHSNLSKMRILIQTSRHSTYIQYACETLHQGFKKIGCKSLLLRERKYQGAGYNLEFVAKAFKKFKPDLIIVINNFKAEWIKQFMPGIPVVTWIHDPPETLARPCQSVDDNDFIFAAVNSLINRKLPEAFPALRGYDICLLPFIRDINTNYPMIEKKKYNIGCITNLDVSPEILSYYEPEKSVGSDLERITHSLLAQMESLEPFEIASIIASKEKSVSTVQNCLTKLNLKKGTVIDKTHSLVVDTLQYGVGPFLQKTLPIRYLMNKGFHQFFLGGFGWDKIQRFKPYAAGQIPHNELIRTAGNIAINLNPSPALTFHPRIGEMLEANSFVISSWKGDADDLSITDFFIEDEEVVLFRTYKDLAYKVEYYLKHPEKRNAITKRAKEKFSQDFSAETGCRKILNRVLNIDIIK